jgi:hypothetical protein
MKTLVLTVGVVLGVFATGSQLHAQYYYPVIPQAPDACWGGYYQPNYYGQWYGPNYCVYPPFQPFQGMVPAPPRPAYQPGMPPRPGLVAVPGAPPTMQMPYSGIVAFPSHQWARSPRDFFMVD